MRLLCQHIAQRSNRETSESGEFWEARFKAVRLLDESALLACVAYVDLNSIRAALAQTIDTSDFTSAKKRIEALLLRSAAADSKKYEPPRSDQSGSASKSPTIQAPDIAADQLLPDRSLSPVDIDERVSKLGAQSCATGFRCSDKGFLNMTCEQYLELLDWAARKITPGKHGSTPEQFAPLFERLGFTAEGWLEVVRNFGTLFHNVAGAPHEIAQARTCRGKACYRVRPKAREVFAGGPST